MDWTTETFKVGGYDIPYKDVDSYETKLDYNGNSTYKLTTYRSGIIYVRGMDAYAFDPTKVMDRLTKMRLLAARKEIV